MLEQRYIFGLPDSKEKYGEQMRSERGYNEKQEKPSRMRIRLRDLDC